MNVSSHQHRHFEWSDSEEPERGAVECQKCSNFISRGAFVCPACGRLFPAHRVLRVCFFLGCVAALVAFFWLLVRQF